MTAPCFLLVDANVLIDYQAASLSLLELVSRHVGRVHVLSTVIAEVDGLDAEECDRLGIYVVEPTLEQLTEANKLRGRLSFEDWTCLIACRDRCWTCVTNDILLRKHCTGNNVPVRWGLELILELVALGELSAAGAEQAAGRIQQSNPMYLTDKVLAEFRKKLARIAR